VLRHHDNAKIFTALSDVTRLRILDLLQNGDKTATALREELDIVQSTLSHHVKILVDSGVVNARKDGKWTLYSINQSGGLYASKLLKLLTSTQKPGIAPNSKLNRRPEIMNNFSIVVDTSCDISPEYLKTHDIDVVPVPFTLDGKEHKLGGWQDITAKDFYGALRSGGVSKTTQVNPEQFYESFESYAKEGKDVLYIVLSSGLSGTFQSALIALSEIKEKYPDANIYPVDSIGATSTNALLAHMAVKKRQEGATVAETAAYLDERKNYCLGFFTVDDLMYLHRGGRLSKLSAIGGSVLGIKPILTIKPDGMLSLKSKVRGRAAAFKQMIAYLKKGTNEGRVHDTIYIVHTDCEDDARKLADMVKAEVKVNNLKTIMMCPVIGTHLGPGAVTLVFEADITRNEYVAE